MKKLIISLLFISFIITGCGCKENKVVNKFEKEYESLNGEKTSSGKTYPSVDIPSDNKIEYASMDDLKEIFENKKSGVIYFGYPECPWCRSAIPNLIKAAKKTSLEKIYYLNVHDMRDTYIYQDGKPVKTKEGTDDYYQILKWLDTILDDYEVNDGDNKIKVGEKRLYVPTVVFVKDGTIVGYHSDTVGTQKDPYVLLNEEQEVELQNIYENLIHKVLNDLCDESC